MQSTEEALLSFFNQVALKNAAILVTLKSEQCFDINAERWQFKLPDLHTFLQQHECAFTDIDYSSFRKLLFTCPINQAVRSNGGEIIITENHNNVDKTTYSLLWS